MRKREDLFKKCRQKQEQSSYRLPRGYQQRVSRFALSSAVDSIRATDRRLSPEIPALPASRCSPSKYPELGSRPARPFFTVFHGNGLIHNSIMAPILEIPGKVDLKLADIAEVAHPRRPRDTSFYAVLILAVIPIWSIVPLSWVFVLYALRTGKIWSYTWIGQALFALALVEVRFITLSC